MFTCAMTLVRVAGRTGATMKLGGRSDFSLLLRHFRRSAGLSQEVLAERSGYSHSYIGKLERGDRPANPGIADVLASALGLSVHERAVLVESVPVDLTPALMDL